MSFILRACLCASLVVLLFVPLNEMTILLWMAGFAIFVSAIVALRKARGARLATLLLTIALFPATCANLGRALAVVGADAKALADTVAATCTKERRCPPHARACAVGDNERATCRTSGSLGVQFPIRYRLADDGMSFRVFFSRGMDDSTTFRGGVDIPVTRQSFVDGIDIDADAGPR